MHLWGTLAILLALTACAQAACKLTGVNQAGAEGGSVLPGKLGYQYTYPKATADYFVQKRMNVFRLPFRWQRMIQPTINSNFSAPDIAAYIDSLNYMTKNAYVIIDPHDFGSAFGGIIGESNTTIQNFADFWVKIANVFKGNPRVIYGLMNEPISNNVYVWRQACQAAINGIRSTGATQTILVPGVWYTGAHSWVSSGSAEVMWDIQDPANNYAYEVHQYLDSDSSGQHPDCVSATFGVSALTGFTDWLRTYNKMGFLGEFDGGSSAVCLQGIDNMISYMDQNSDVWLGWTYWSGGPWWGECWCSLQPNATGIDRAQWAVVAPHVNPVLPTTLVVGKTTPPGPVYVSIYKDGLTNGWADYGWAPHNNANTTLQRTGTSSISFKVGSGSNLCYVRGAALNTTSYTYVQFWIYLTSGSTDGISVTMVTVVNGHPNSVGPGLRLTSLLSTAFSANTWLQVTVPLRNYTTSAAYDGFMLGGSGSSQSGYIDDIYQVKYVYQGDRVCVGPVAEEHAVSVVCPKANQTISYVNFVSYGNPSGSCGSYAKGSCDSTLSATVFNTYCQGRHSCSFIAGKTLFPDPCPGTRKQFIAQVTCA